MVKQSIETAISVPPASHGPLTGSNEKQKINTIQGVKPNYFNAYTSIYAYLRPLLTALAITTDAYVFEFF